nr:hypothetical protein [Limosilactobacillus reuteri]
MEEYTPLEVKSNVAQLLNQVNWTGAQIAKVYGVSDSIINGQGDQQSSIQMMGNAMLSHFLDMLKQLRENLIISLMLISLWICGLQLTH